jgi:tetratricopeptide (TPR) repeat protein
MFYRRQITKAGIFIAAALFLILGSAFAQTAEEAVERGIEYYKQEQDEEAINEFNKAIEIDPNCAEAYYNRGKAEEFDYADQAIADYSKAIKLNPNYVEAYNWRGMAYELDKKNYDQAIADFTRAIEINPNYINAYVNRGTAYNSKKEYDKAIADDTRVIEMEPNNPKHYSDSRAWAYYGKGDYDKAWADVHKAESLGGSIDRDFLEKLKKASGREK